MDTHIPLVREKSPVETGRPLTLSRPLHAPTGRRRSPRSRPGAPVDFGRPQSVHRVGPRRARGPGRRQPCPPRRRSRRWRSRSAPRSPTRHDSRTDQADFVRARIHDKANGLSALNLSYLEAIDENSIAAEKIASPSFTVEFDRRRHAWLPISGATLTDDGVPDRGPFLV